MKRASFTVLMCTYFKDDPYLLEKSIESVFKNSTKPNHFILTIDGPIPKLNEKIINKISKKYPIELNLLDKNIGLALALNNALNLVKTEWIARADSDDINLYDRFNKQLALTNKNFDVIGSNILEIDSFGKLPKLTKNIPVTNKEIRKYLKLRNPINHMTVLYKTKLINSVGGYPNIYLREDYALCILIMSIATVFPVLYYFVIMGKTGLSPTLEIVTSFGIWLLCSVAVMSCRSTILDASNKMS